MHIPLGGRFIVCILSSRKVLTRQPFSHYHSTITLLLLPAGTPVYHCRGVINTAQNRLIKISAIKYQWKRLSVWVIGESPNFFIDSFTFMEVKV